MKKSKARLVGLAALVSTLALGSAALAASDLFLKVEGINGDSFLKGHEKDVEIQSFSWGVSAATSWTKGGGAAVGKASPREVTITKGVDSASPVFIKYMAQGKVVPNMTFVVQAKAPSAGATPPLKITLEGVYFTDIKVTVSEGGDLSETVSLVFKKITYEYRPTDAKGGKGAAIVTSWDIPAGTTN